MGASNMNQSGKSESASLQGFGHILLRSIFFAVKMSAISLFMAQGLLS
jgi:hypothetical protein